MDSSEQAAEFRQRAEDSIQRKGGESPESPVSDPSQEMARLMHELKVRQIELEMQNEELLRSRLALEASQTQYFDLYDRAPVAYLTMNEQWRILEINRAAVALLGIAQDTAFMNPFSSFVAQDSQDTLHLHRNGLLVNGEVRSCELQMVRADRSTFMARLECKVLAGTDGAPLCRATLSDITEQKRSYETLRASADFTSSLINSMHDGFSVLDTKGVAMDANPALCEMTGFSKEELLGAGPPHPYWPSEEYQNIQDALEETMSGSGSGYELIFMRKDGQRFPVLVSAFPVLDQDGETTGYAATVKDITLRKQAEATMEEWNKTLEQRVVSRTMELQASESRFRQLAEATFEGIAISENGILIDGNSQLAAMFRCDISEITGRPVMDFVAPESRSKVLEEIGKGFEGCYEFVGLLKDGTEVPMEAQGRTMDWKGRKASVTAVRDLSEKKRVAAELESQRSILDQSLRLAMVSEISAGIIHQLGQPLTSIMLNLVNAESQLGICKTKTCGYPNVLDSLKSEIIGCMKIMTHLRALGDLEIPQRLPFDFNEMISQEFTLIRQQAQDQGVRVRITTDNSIPPVFGDAVQLVQVFNNLMRNAFDACREVPEARRYIAVKTRHIPDGSVELCVSDKGGGIAPDVMKLLFSPFFTTKTDGLGIGLRLSRTIIQAHGGSIEALNNPHGIGVTFRVVLPVGTERDYTKVSLPLRGKS